MKRENDFLECYSKVFAPNGEIKECGRDVLHQFDFKVFETRWIRCRLWQFRYRFSQHRCCKAVGCQEISGNYLPWRICQQVEWWIRQCSSRKHLISCCLFWFFDFLRIITQRWRKVKPRDSSDLQSTYQTDWKCYLGSRLSVITTRAMLL